VPLFARFRLGDGRLDPKLLAKLEAEGLVIAEEGLRGTVSYDHFKAPGKRFNGKVSGERIGLGVSEHRVAAYCRSGTVKLVDTEYDNPRLRAVDFLVEDVEKLAIVVDYDELGDGNVSGKITIRARTPRAREFVDAINSRLER
jgi:hypothetical protein